MKIEIGKGVNIPEGYEAVEYGILQAGDTYLGYDGKEIYTEPSSYVGHSSVCRLKLRRKLYAPIPEGYVEDGWIEAGTTPPYRTLYLHRNCGIQESQGIGVLSHEPLLRLKKKTRTAIVLTARVVLPEGSRPTEPIGSDVWIRDVDNYTRRHHFYLTESTEEVSA